MKNAFTIDTEDWYHANFRDNLFSNDGSMVSTVEANVDRYLQIFSDNNVKATFFILGCIVEKHSDMVRRIADEGHEIASHGYAHQLVYRQKPEEFRCDVYKSKVLLEDAVGTEVIGYRAPSWSITEESLWALDILNELGFKYNSAIFPTSNFLFGIPYAPRGPHNADVYGKKLEIITIPPGTRKIFNNNIPFSGGAYFRLLPLGIIKSFSKYVNRKENMPVVFYLHPREIDPKQPKLKLSIKDYVIHYYGIGGCENKLVQILKSYEFDTVRNILNL